MKTALMWGMRQEFVIGIASLNLFDVGNGTRNRFWHDIWSGDTSVA